MEAHLGGLVGVVASHDAKRVRGRDYTRVPALCTSPSGGATQQVWRQQSSVPACAGTAAHSTLSATSCAPACERLTEVRGALWLLRVEPPANEGPVHVLELLHVALADLMWSNVDA